MRLSSVACYRAYLMRSMPYSTHYAFVNVDDFDLRTDW